MEMLMEVGFKWKWTQKIAESTEIKKINFQKMNVFAKYFRRAKRAGFFSEILKKMKISGIFKNYKKIPAREARREIFLDDAW